MLQFKITCPECGEYLIVDGFYESADPSVGIFEGYALIEQDVVLCVECGHRVDDTERDEIERRISKNPHYFNLSNW